MEGLESLFGLIPPEWLSVAGSLMVALAALRTLLRTVVAVCYALDVALDGRADWHWIARLGTRIDKLDDLLERLPVKAPLVRGK